MSRILLTYTFLLICLCSNGQDIFKKIDSLTSLPDYAAAEKIITLFSATDPTTKYLLQNRLAEIQITEGKLDQAELTLHALTSPGNDGYLNAITKTNLGFLYLNKARNDLALQNLQGALNGFQASTKSNSLEAAKCLTYLSSLYLSTGKLNQAEDNGLQALQIRQNLKGETSEEVAASYNDLGLVYSQSDPDKALDFYEKALAVYQKLHSADHPKIAIANTNIGFLYRQLQLYGDAVNNFESAEGTWKKIYPNGHPNQALALVNLGLTYKEMGNIKAATGYFERAIDIYKKSYGDKHPSLSYVYNEVAVIRLGENSYDAALADIQNAICSNTPSFNDKNIQKNPKVNEYYNGMVLLYSLRLKAQALESKHFGRTLKFDELRLALSSLHSCDTLIDDIRYHSSDENDKLELGSSAGEVYAIGVRLAFAMSQMSIDFKKYREEAFYFAEKSKSAVLQESIADAEAKSFAGIPASLLDDENRLKSIIALLSQKLSDKPAAEEEKKLRSDLFVATQQYDQFTQRLEKDFPEYYNLKFNHVNPSTADLQKTLDNKTAIVSYFIEEKTQRLYSFIISKNSFKVFNSTLPADFDRMIKGFNNSLFYTVPESYRTSSNALSKVLLRGIPSSYSNLIIIPAGRLSTLPFEALTTKQIPEVFSFSDANFVVKKFGVSYEFSAGILLQKSKATNQSAAQSIFLCAPISFPEKDNLDDLPATDLEVDNIGKLFAANKLVAKRTDANETLIKSGNLSDYRYLHFATHGVVDEKSPELSRIYLQSSPSEDGNVFSGEIFNLKLNADLAVLSACQTGLGKFSKGEGVIGLSRALVYAGAKSIMVSYWSVADESTADLMTNFYINLLAQPKSNFAEALQQAKLKMIATGKYSAPYYWAPFVLIGQ
jgi:CHAT domain-containing protein